MCYPIISEGKGIPQYVPSVFHCSVVSDSCDPMDYSPPRLLCPWKFLGKNIGMGCHFFLQGFFQNQGLKPGSGFIFCATCTAGRFFTH